MRDWKAERTEGLEEGNQRNFVIDTGETGNIGIVCVNRKNGREAADKRRTAVQHKRVVEEGKTRRLRTR